MAKNYQVGLIIKGNAKGGVSAVKATKDELTKLNQKQRRFQKESKSSSLSIGQMTKDFNLLSGGVAAAGAAMVVGLGGFAKQVLETGIQFSGFNSALIAITGNQEAATSELDFAGNTARRLGLDIASTTKEYIKFAASSAGTAIEGLKAKKVFTSISESARILNLTTDESAGILNALSQMLSKGTVQAEELKGQLGERLPGAFKIAADAMGITTQKLNKLLQDGKVLATDLLPKLADELKSRYGKGLESALNGPAKKLGDLKNAWTDFVVATSNTGVLEQFANSFSLISTALNSVTPHIAKITAAFFSLAKILAAGGALLIGFKTTAALMGLLAIAGKSLAINVLAASMAFKAGVGPIGLFTSSLNASVAATTQAVVATGLLKSAVLGLFSAFAGWEIGTYLREQFVEVRVAGLAFVGAMETGLVNLTYAFESIAPRIKVFWGELTTWLQQKLGALYKLVGDGLGKIGATNMSKSYLRFADSLSAAGASANDAQKALDKLEAQRRAEIELIDETIVSLIQQEISQKSVNEINEKRIKTEKDNSEVHRETLNQNEKLIISLAEQVHMLGLSEEQKLLHINLSKLSADATESEIAQVKALTIAQLEQAQMAESVKAESVKAEDDFYQKAIEGASGVSDAWSSAGNVIVDTFGSIGQQMEKLIVTQEKYSKALAINAKKQKESGADLSKLKKEERALQRASASESIQGYASIAGAAASMFDEQSKARKALHAMEQVFTVAEIALAMQRAYANAIAGVANQANGDPYSAFARMAAMAAAMAALGIAVSSSGSAPASAEQRQKTQGTGTVLGSDDKSASILNSYERIEELELDQYAELREMNDSLRSLNDNITHLAAQLVVNFGKFNDATYGGPLGTVEKYQGKATKHNEIITGTKHIFGDPLGDLANKVIGSFNTTKRTLIDSGVTILTQTLGEIVDTGLVEAQAYFDIKTKKKSFWGLKKKTSYNTEYEDVSQQLEHELALIFTNIGDSVNQAVDVLGLDVARSLENFVIDLPNISFKDLSGDEIQAELEAVFSQQADLMATYLVPGLKEYQQVGEGLYDTLIRIAQEQAIFNSVLEITGNSLAGIDANQQIDVAQSIIEFAGSVETLRDATNTYLSEFFSESEQFEHLSKQVTSQFDALGESLPATRDEFKAMVSGLDLTTEAGQKMYAALMLLVPQMAQYYDALDDQNEYLEQKEREREERKQEAAAFNKDVSDRLAQIDFTPLESQLYNLQQRFEEEAAQAKELGLSTAMLRKLYAKEEQKIIDNALDAVNATHERELSKLTSTHESAVKSLVSENDKLVSSITSVAAGIANSILAIRRDANDWNEVAYQAEEIATLRGKLGTGSIDEQLDNISALNAAITRKYQLERDQLSSTREAVDLLNDAQANLSSEYSSAVDSLKSDNERIISSISSVSDSLANSILSIKRSAEGWDEVGYQTSNISALRGKLGTGTVDEQLSTIEELRASITSKYQSERDQLSSTREAVDLLNDAQANLSSEYSSAVDSLKSDNERIISSISNVSDSLANSILSIKRSAEGWDEVGYQTSNISALRGKLGTGTVDEQLSTIEELSVALQDKYRAELDASRELSDLANQRYQDDLNNYKSLAEAAKNLKKAADDLRFGELSTFTNTEQFGFAEAAFNQVLNSGNLANLQGAGQQYLEVAKAQYGGTASSEYQAIFDKVTSAFSSVNVGSAPSVPREVSQYQRNDAALQSKLISELEALQVLTDELSAAQAESFASEMATLTTSYQSESDSIASQITTKLGDIETKEQALQFAAITELAELKSITEELSAQQTVAFSDGMASLTTSYQSESDSIASQITTKLGDIETKEQALQFAAITELTELRALTAELDAQRQIAFDLAMQEENQAYQAGVALLEAELAKQTQEITDLLEVNNDAINETNEYLGKLLSETRKGLDKRGEPIIIQTPPIYIPQPKPESANASEKAELRKLVELQERQLAESEKSRQELITQMKEQSNKQNATFEAMELRLSEMAGRR